MLTLGLKGGMALHGHTQHLVITELVAVVALGLIIPLVLYPVLTRLVRLGRTDAISIAAHYGSVSAGTFAVVIAMVEKSGMILRPETTLYLVLLELPAIVVMLWLHRYLSAKQPLEATVPNTQQSSILHEALTSRGVIL